MKVSVAAAAALSSVSEMDDGVESNCFRAAHLKCAVVVRQEKSMVSLGVFCESGLARDGTHTRGSQMESGGIRKGEKGVIASRETGQQVDNACAKKKRTLKHDWR